MNIEVFIGMSLSHEESIKVLKANYHPPVRRGDLPRLPAGTKFVGIVDGIFLSESSVGHREIIELMRRGVTVVGGGSMGALRAAELEDLGMIGVGKVFQMYRDGTIEGDDEVALVFDPDEHTPLSEPLVNIRHFLGEAVHRGVLESGQAMECIDAISKIYYPRRSFSELLRIASGFVDEVTLRALSKMLQTESFDLKRMDALEVLYTLKRLHNPSDGNRRK